MIIRFLRREGAALVALCLGVSLLGCSTGVSGANGDHGGARAAAQLTVGSTAARACDVVLETTGSKTIDVRFAPGVRGQATQRESRLALSFIASADAPLPSPAAVLDRGSFETTTVVSASCFDARAQSIATPDARVDDASRN
jgi:hypothetical protein